MIQEGVSDTFRNSELALGDGVAHICSTRSLICKLKKVDTPHLGYQNTPCICIEHGYGDMGRLISGTYVHLDLSRYPVNHI